MASESREALENRVQKALFQESVFRWESAALIALTLLLTTAAFILGGTESSFSIGSPFIWLIGGAVAEALLVYSSLKDPEFGRKVVADLLKHEFQPERLRDKRLQEQINTALDYRSRIEKAIRERTDTVLKAELSATASQIEEWLENMYSLAQRIDRYQAEQQILERDRKKAETRVQQLRRDYAQEDNTAVKNQIQATLESLERQLDTLNSLEDTIQRAQLQIEHSLTNLATIYSQTMLVDAKGEIDSSRARRLRQEIADEVIQIHDVLVAMDEVQATQN